MKVLYFSWIKDKLGKSYEEIQVSDNIKTINDLITLLNSHDKKKSNNNNNNKNSSSHNDGNFNMLDEGGGGIGGAQGGDRNQNNDIWIDP